MIYWTHFKKCLRYNEHNIPERRTRKPRARLSTMTSVSEVTTSTCRNTSWLLKEFLRREYVTAWKGQVKQQSRSLEYWNKCEHQLISGINDERLMSTLQNMGRRDKTTKGMVLF